MKDYPLVNMQPGESVTISAAGNYFRVRSLSAAGGLKVKALSTERVDAFDTIIESGEDISTPGNIYKKWIIENVSGSVQTGRVTIGIGIISSSKIATDVNAVVTSLPADETYKNRVDIGGNVWTARMFGAPVPTEYGYSQIGVLPGATKRCLIESLRLERVNNGDDLLVSLPPIRVAGANIIPLVPQYNQNHKVKDLLLGDTEPAEVLIDTGYLNTSTPSSNIFRKIRFGYETVLVIRPEHPILLEASATNGAWLGISSTAVGSYFEASVTYREID